MNERIKAIRKYYKLTQAEFGEKIGVKGNTVTGYETGIRSPSDAVIVSICREFGCHEAWLRNGTGEMLVEKSKEQEMLDFFNTVATEETDSFKRRFIHALAKIPSDEWGHIEDFIATLQEKEQNNDSNND